MTNKFMPARIAWALMLAGLFFSGCLSQNLSREYPTIVGREFVTTRQFYLMEGWRVTSVAFNTHTRTWWLIEIEPGERLYDLKPGRGPRQKKVRDGETVCYTDIPAGTRLRVDAVFAHLETGTHVIGTLAHPDTGERIPWVFDLGLYTPTAPKWPWE